MRPSAYRIELEPRVARPGDEPTAAEIAAYYAAHLPPGGPPLEAVRAHVVEALRRSRSAPVAEDALAAQASALDLHLLFTQQGALARLPSSRRFPAELVGVRFLDAAERVAAVAEALEHVERDPRDSRGRRLIAPRDVREQLVHELRAARELLEVASRSHRRFRLVPCAREVSFEEQLAVLAAAGIRPRPGTTRQDLLRNWPAEEWAARPWRRLHDLLEHTDDAVGLALKCIETEDDRQIYGAIVACLRDLARGRLPLAKIESDIDFDRQTARCAFELDGARHRPDLRWHGEWLDMEIFEHLGSLLHRRAPRWRFYFLADPEDLGEEITICCLSREGAQRLAAAGAPVVPLGKGRGS